MEIPETRREEDALRDHEEQQRRHEETIKDHKDHTEDGVAYHHMKEAERVEDEQLGYREKADRDHANQADHELTEEYDTMLENE